MLIIADIFLKYENEFVLCDFFGSIWFLSSPGTGTIICIQSKTENIFREKKKLPLLL